jgi:hypothetical protein
MKLLFKNSWKTGSPSAVNSARLPRAARFALSILCALSPLASQAAAQTTVDLRTQSKNVDFSGAVSTKPTKTGTVLPPTCAVGEIFFQLNAAPGQNLYLCASLNTWTVLNGAGSGGQSLPFATITTAGMVSIVNASTAAYGCNGANSLVTAGTTTIAPLSGSASEPLLIGISCKDAHLKLIAPTNTLLCTASVLVCDSVPGSAFTDGVIPLASIVMTTNGTSSFTFGPPTDLRAPLQDDPLTAGTGIVYTKTGSTRALAVDTTAVPLLATGNDYSEITAPAAPGSGKERIYAKTGAGLCAKDSSGIERCTTSFAGANDLTENAAPAAPAAGQERVYAKTGSGLCAKDSSGIERCTFSPALANDFTEITAPAAPAASQERVYAKSGSGLCAKDSAGIERCTSLPEGSMATAGQGSFIPFSLLNLTNSTLQVTSATTMRCAEFWAKVPYTLHLNFAVAKGQIADAANYFGFAIYDSAGNRLTGATSTGAHIAAAVMSIALSGSPALAATGDYLACWANNGSGTLLHPDDASNYSLFLNGGDPSGIPRAFDAANAVSFSGATITWPATTGARTAITATPPAIALVP